MGGKGKGYELERQERRPLPGKPTCTYPATRPAEDKTTLNVGLAVDDTALDDVVVGYGTQKSGNVTETEAVEAGRT